MRCWRCETKAVVQTWEGLRCVACGADQEKVQEAAVQDVDPAGPEQSKRMGPRWWWDDIYAAREHDGSTCSPDCPYWHTS